MFNNLKRDYNVDFLCYPRPLEILKVFKEMPCLVPLESVFSAFADQVCTFQSTSTAPYCLSCGQSDFYFDVITRNFDCLTAFSRKCRVSQSLHLMPLRSLLL